MADAGNVAEHIQSREDGLLLQRPTETLVICFDAPGRSALKFKPTGLPMTDFCGFVGGAGKPQVVRFFREIMEEVEVKRGIMDFHLKVRDKKSSFNVDVYHGLQVAGPVEVPPGIGCRRMHIMQF